MTMNRVAIIHLGSLVFLLAVAACDGGGSAPQEPPVATLDEGGVSPALISVETGGSIQFVNGDQGPHQLYSYDCSELSTMILQPAAEVSVQLGVGPKVCHFQDMLAPLSSQYWGTVEVAAPPPLPPTD